MTLEQARNWLNNPPSTADKKQVFQVLDLYYRLLQQSQNQKRQNRKLAKQRRSIQ